MARQKTISDEGLIRLLDEYRLDNPDGKVSLPKFGMYIRDKGYDVQDYTIRRSAGFREYLERVNNRVEEVIQSDLVTYSTLDADAFLKKNRTKDSLKTALITRDMYYARIAAHAVDAIKSRKAAEAKTKELEKQVAELTEKLANVQAKADNADIRRKDAAIAKLKQFIKDYLYPDAANAILEKEGILDVVSSIIPEEKMESITITADTEIKPSEYDSVNKLMGGFDD